jgi:hypothetical protein
MPKLELMRLSTKLKTSHGATAADKSWRNALVA